MTSDQVRVLDPVEFHGQALTVVNKDEQPYVAMKPIVDGMGLDWASQFTKFTEDTRRWGTVVIRATVAADGKTREMTCLPLRKLTRWLMTLQPSRMNPFVAEKVMIYQDECEDALWAYWTKVVEGKVPMSNKESTSLQSMSFNDYPVRIHIIDGEPWWVAKDVAEALGYVWNGSSRIEHVPEKWRRVTSVVTLRGDAQDMAILSEQGLYWFLARSDKPRAFPFQEWIAGEVLPSIRKTGKYSAIPEDPKLMGLPDFIDPAASAMAWAEQYNRRMAAEAAAREAQTRVHILASKIDDDAPLVDFADRLQSAPTTHLVGAVAKMIQQGTGMSMGQNRLFVWLRENNYIHRTGSRKNQPTQRSLDAGLFVLQVRNITVHDEDRVKYTTRVTGKGLMHLYEQFFRMAVELGLKPDPMPKLVTSAEILRQLPLWEDEDADGVDEGLVDEARKMVPKK
jgi:anti-repressor protein